MRTLRPISILAATLLSCGPEPAQAPEFEELCGSEGPHRLFALEPEEIVSALGGVQRIEDRLLFVAGRGTEDDPFGLPIPSEPNVHSTDLCGQNHVIAAEDIYGIRAELTPWPGALLGCRTNYGGDLYLLDPHGVVPPELVPDVSCRGWHNAHGLVRTEPTGDDVARLLFFPYAAGPTPAFEPAVLLLDDVVDRIRTNQVFADEVLSLTPAGELVRVSLPGGAVTVEQSDVESFHASSDGRWLLWEDARTLDAHAADVFLRDRQTRVDTLVARADLRNRWPSFGSDFVRISFGSDVGERFVWLPSLEISDVPAGWHTVHRIPDGRWLVSAGFPTTGPLALRDLVTGEQTLLTDMTGAVSWGDEYVNILHGVDPDSQIGTGELWRFRYDGSEPQRLARRAGRFTRTLSDGRLVTVIDHDAAGYGRLIAVDPDTLAETLIDERVFTLQFANLFGDETIVYQVDDGERSGVWAVKLAPRE